MIILFNNCILPISLTISFMFICFICHCQLCYSKCTTKYQNPPPFIIIMYEKQTSLLLLIAEFGNIGVMILFLTLFTNRFYRLRSFSLTDRFKNYFPKLRIFLASFYIALSLTLLAYNLITDSYSQRTWYQYILQGGGGECIDSLILLIQLGVLRLELKKQQPYTRFHIAYFIYLAFMSIVRFIFTLIDVLNEQNDSANLIISICFVADSCIQLGYWWVKKQSLPQFIKPTDEQIDDLRRVGVSDHRIRNIKKSFNASRCSGFPYIYPLVSLENGKIRIAFQKVVMKKNDQCKLNSSKNRDRSETNLISLLQSFQDEVVESKEEVELLTSHIYSIKQIQEIYISSGHFMLQHQLSFQTKQMGIFVRALQNYLQLMLREIRCYQPQMLRPLKFQRQIIKQYEELSKQYVLSSDFNINNDLVTGLKIPQDKNATYFSVYCFRVLQIHHQLFFYFQVSILSSKKCVYVAKKYEDFEENNCKLKKIIKEINKILQLPMIPKKTLFSLKKEGREKDQMKYQCQQYLRKLCNDYTLMENSSIKQKILQFVGFQGYESVKAKHQSSGLFRDMKLAKVETMKALVKNEYVTIYAFNLTKQNRILLIKKTHSHFQSLHQQIERWAKNAQLKYYSLPFPQKQGQNSQTHLIVLYNYLQQLLKIDELYKNYAFKAFLNLNNNEENCLFDFDCSSRSNVLSLQKRGYSINDVIESSQNQFGFTEQSSKKFNHVIDNLDDYE